MSNLQSLFEKIKLDAESSTSYYVYYTSKTGKIHKVSPRLENTEYKILEIQEEQAQPFLKGEKQTSNFRVSFDFVSKCPALTEINNKNNLGTYENILYNIPKNNQNADLIITQDFAKKQWVIQLDKDTLKFINQHKINLFDTMMFSITKKDDPNILYKNLYVEQQDILNKSVSIPFDSNFEFDADDVSIYTNRHFNTYDYRIKYE